MNPDIAVALRIILTFAGGFAVARNWLDNPQLELLVGAVLTLIATAWGWWSNRAKSGEAQKIAEKVAQSPDVAPSIVKLDAGQVITEGQVSGRRETDPVLGA